MIAAFLLLLQAAAPPIAQVQVVPTIPATPPATAPASAPVSGPLPPQDWSTLPPLRIRRQATTLANTSAYVHGEVMAGRCAKAVRTVQGWSLSLDLAVLMTRDGRVRRITPRAIDCPTVEQYAAGVILGARDSIDVVDTDTDTWYRTSLTFAWGA
ncbi:hypothetical protein [Sphingomonas albertensis]|uniref:Uncharacterized protein n=1 Tax=Sphingomonas albertensis TaxID=2762591 RepID=A0ABR7AMG0_9SPHN|nr:hypothetical protein [Sphingomonas albertensis]MBC3941640.1 hypothetical protein [Sphingomonas albertensis]